MTETERQASSSESFRGGEAVGFLIEGAAPWARQFPFLIDYQLPTISDREASVRIDYQLPTMSLLARTLGGVRQPPQRPSAFLPARGRD